MSSSREETIAKILRQQKINKIMNQQNGQNLSAIDKFNAQYTPEQQLANEEVALRREEEVTRQANIATEMAGDINPSADLINNPSLVPDEVISEDERIKRIAIEKGIGVDGVPLKVSLTSGFGNKYPVIGSADDVLQQSLDQYWTETLNIRDEKGNLIPYNTKTRIGKDTGRLEYAIPNTVDEKTGEELYTLVNNPDLDLGDFAKWGGESLVMGGEVVGGLIGLTVSSATTGGLGTIPAVATGTAIGAFIGEIIRQAGGKILDVNDATTNQIITNALITAGFTGTVAGVTDGLLHLGKAVLNRWQGKMYTTKLDELNLDDEASNSIITDINKKLNQKVDPNLEDPNLKLTAGQTGGDQSLLALEDMYRTNPNYGFSSAYTNLDVANNKALEAYEKLINENYNVSNLPMDFKGAKLKQDILKTEVYPNQSRAVESVNKTAARLEKQYEELPNFDLESVGLELRPLAKAKRDAIYETFAPAFQSFKRDDIFSSGENLTQLFSEISKESKRGLIKGVVESRKTMIAGFDSIRGNKSLIKELDGSDGLITYMETIKTGGKVSLTQIQEALADVRLVLRNKNSEITKDTNLLNRIKTALKTERQIMLQDDPDLFNLINLTEEGYGKALRDVNETVVGGMLKKDDSGKFVIADEDVFNAILKGNNNVVDANAVSKIIADSPAAKDAFKRQILAKYKKEVYVKDKNTGQMKPSIEKHRVFMADYDRGLTALLDKNTIKNMDSMGVLASKLEKEIAIQDNTLKAINKSTGMKLQNLDPEAIGKWLLDEKNGYKSNAFSVKNSLKDSPESLKLVQDMLVNHVSLSIRKDGFFDFDRLNDVITTNGDVISTIVGKDYLKDLSTLRDGIALTTRKHGLKPEQLQTDNGFLEKIVRAVYYPPLSPRGRVFTAVQGGKNTNLIKALGEALQDPEKLKLLVNSRYMTLDNRASYNVLSVLGMTSLFKNVPSGQGFNNDN